MSLMETLLKQVSGSNLSALSKQIGSDEKTTGNAISAALPVLMGALARNSAQPEGANALHNALSKDHDGSVLENVSGFLGSGGSTDTGAGILRHVLGQKQPAVERSISKTSGLDAGSAGKMLTMLAPMVMGALGKQQRQSNLDASQLAGLLGQERNIIEKKSPAAGALSALLDTDGDGDVDLGDLTKSGLGGALGKLFGSN